MTKSTPAYPTDLNDTEMALIAPYLPAACPTGRPREHDWRAILNAIFYMVRAGCPWRLLPTTFPPWKTTYHYFRVWRLEGRWEQINTALRQAVREKAGRHPQPSAAIIDSQSVKTVEGGAARGYDAGKKILGRKRHVVVDTLGLILWVVVTAASVPDREGALQLLQGLFERCKHSKYSRWCRLKLIWADGGYRGALIAWVKRALGWTLEIVEKLADARGFQVVPKRWIVERTFAWLNRQRRLSKDYERLPQTSEAFIYVAMTRVMLKRLAHK